MYVLDTNRAPCNRGTEEVYDKNGKINKIVIWRDFKKFKTYLYKNGKKTQIFPKKTKEIQKDKVVKEQIDKVSKEDILKKIKKLTKDINSQVKEKKIRITSEEITIIRNHVQKYFNLPYSIYSSIGDHSIIILKVSTSRDGKVNNVEIYDKSLYQKDNNFKSVADSAKKAVFDSSPLPLSKGKEKLFRSLIFDFSPSFISNY